MELFSKLVTPFSVHKRNTGRFQYPFAALVSTSYSGRDADRVFVDWDVGPSDSVLACEKLNGYVIFCGNWGFGSVDEV